MTILEKIAACKACTDFEHDSIEKLIAIAYWIGREEATREISDKYNDLIRDQRRRAAECRYHKMAAEIVGDISYIYSSDYAGDITETFGSDQTDI